MSKGGDKKIYELAVNSSREAGCSFSRNERTFMPRQPGRFWSEEDGLKGDYVLYPCFHKHSFVYLPNDLTRYVRQKIKLQQYYAALVYRIEL